MTLRIYALFNKVTRSSSILFVQPTAEAFRRLLKRSFADKESPNFNDVVIYELGHYNTDVETGELSVVGCKPVVVDWSLDYINEVDS